MVGGLGPLFVFLGLTFGVTVRLPNPWQLYHLTFLGFRVVAMATPLPTIVMCRCLIMD